MERAALKSVGSPLPPDVDPTSALPSSRRRRLRRRWASSEEARDDVTEAEGAFEAGCAFEAEVVEEAGA